MIEELVKKNRSYRRFYEEKELTEAELTALIDVARLVPSGGNNQPVRYKAVCDKATNAKIYDCIGWAAYLKDWDGPVPGERPAGYIIMATDKKVNAGIDEGIAGQTLLLAATEKGIGGCFLGNVKRDEVAKIISLPEDMKIDLVIALGYPKEEVVLEDVGENGDIKYYRDENAVHHVPKRKLEDILF